MQKNIHEITLTGYGAKGRNLNFGTWGSVGLEQLHIAAQSPWEEAAVITVTFLNGKVQSEPQVLPADGILDVPAAATSAANKSKGSCKMVFKGMDGNGAVLYSTDLLYTVQSRTEIDGKAYDPGKNAFEQYVQQTNSARDNALAAASNARDSEIAAGGYRDEAKKAAEEAAGSAEAAAKSKTNAKNSEEAARQLKKEILELGAKLPDKNTKLEKVCIYYGYPVGIGNTWDVNAAAEIYKKYDLCVLGDTYELPEQEVYADTVAVLKKVKELSPKTKLAGYVPIGVQQVGEDSGLSMEELKRRVQLWKDIGADGIFLDEFGYDYGVSRARQNEIVRYVHEMGMFCIANSWQQDYVFSSKALTVESLPDFAPNPDGLAPELGEEDYSLLENMFYSCEREKDESVTLKASSCWRVADGYSYYSATQEEYGTSYYKKFRTKLLQLDAIPHALNATQKNTLMTLAILAAKIFNIPAVAFGDEDWGASGYYYDWDIPTGIDLSEDLSEGLHAVTAENKGKEETAFPYKWSANVQGNTLSLVYDVENGEDETWDDATHYVTVNGVVVRNAWQTIYEFGEEVAAAKKSSAAAVEQAKSLKAQVEEALPTVANAESRLQEILANANAQTEDAYKKMESALADVAGVTSGFGFKEVQW